MDYLICPDCGKQFPNQPPYRITGKYQGDVVKCPYCNSTGNPRHFMPKSENTAGIGIQLQSNPNFQTPSQSMLQQLQKISPNIENTAGIGIQLQSNPNFQTPSQSILQQLQKISQNIENKGFIKIADKIDIILKNY